MAQELAVISKQLVQTGKTITIPMDEYQSLLSDSRKLQIVLKAYEQIADELFPVGGPEDGKRRDWFGRSLDSDRILNEVKSLRTIHARSSRLNLMLGRVKEQLRVNKRILDELEKF